MEEDVNNICESLKKEVLSIGNDIKFNEHKYYSAFRRKNNFASIKIQSKQIKLWVRVPKDKMEDPLKIAKDVSRIGHHGTGDFEITFSSKKDIPYIMNIIKKAYEYDKWQQNDYDLTHHLSKIENSLTEERVLELIKRIKNINSSIGERYSKYQIKFYKNSDFCSIFTQKNQFWIDIKIPKKEINSKDLDIRDHKDKVWTHIRVNNQIDLDLLIPLIKKAFERN
ncbi:hypothetical protein COU53_00885 [Candidatus Pacearchaeota archaeon CG10_big_fil_rev_8_21_14_0_10_30_48]|nr:MAG: hypothetical protein COU53_00885 [Candidatus Pacearchaeota archaeon CG10_big_fil_rev_8_21_14_0_10_30_48]